MVATWASYCTNDHHIPVERTTEIFDDLVQHPVSEATVLKASEHLDTCIAPAPEAVKEPWRAAAVLHVDESGVRVEGKLHGLHVASTDTLTHDEVHAKRGHEAMEAGGILGAFRGTAVHDHWAPYFRYTACDHALCKAHHLRELHCMHKQYQQPWAKDMADLLCAVKAAVDKTPASAVSLAPSQLEAFAQQYDELVKAGMAAHPRTVPQGPQRGRPKQPPPLHLAMRLHDGKALVLAFMDDFRVPFDTNQGERDIRMVKVKQKVSGGFRTLEGAQRFGRIRGYLSTARKHAKNVFEAIQDALDGTPFIPSPATH
jgi:transposase